MTKNILQRLAVAAAAHPDLPEEVGREIARFADCPDRFLGRDDLLLRLLEQLDKYDPYGDCGCFTSGGTLAAIRVTLKEVLSGSGA